LVRFLVLGFIVNEATWADANKFAIGTSASSEQADPRRWSGRDTRRRFWYQKVTKKIACLGLFLGNNAPPHAVNPARMKNMRLISSGLVTLSLVSLALATGCVERRVVYVPTPAPAPAQPAPAPAQPAPQAPPAQAEVPPPPPNAVVSAQAPPAPQVEVVPVAPGTEYVWAPGYWSVGVGGGWVWIGGHYVVRPHPHAVWVGGHWLRRGHGYVWVGGHWG